MSAFPQKCFARGALRRTPFLLWAAVSAASLGAEPQAGEFELRGVMAVAKDVRYCIYEASKDASVWCRLNEGGVDFVLISADTDRKAVSVRVGARILRLVLKGERMSSDALAAYAVSGTAGLPSNQAELTASAAEEVRQRRLQREQNALQKSGNSLPPDAWR